MTKSRQSSDTQEDRQVIASLEKAMEVLRCFTPAKPELSVSEIARMTGMPQPTVWRVCSTLVKTTHLVQSPTTSLLRPAVTLLGLGFAVLQRLPLRELIRPEMLELAVSLEGAVTLAVPDGTDYMLFAERCYGSAVIYSQLAVGSRVSITETSHGWAYLAGLAEEDRTRLLASHEARNAERWPEMKAAIDCALEYYDRHGFVFAEGVLHSRINSGAIPVVGPESGRVIVLSCGGLADIFTEEVLTDAARELRRIGEMIAPSLDNLTV